MRCCSQCNLVVRVALKCCSIAVGAELQLVQSCSQCTVAVGAALQLVWHCSPYGIAVGAALQTVLEWPYRHENIDKKRIYDEIKGQNASINSFL